MNKIATLTFAVVLSAASAAHAIGMNRGGQKSLTAGSTRRWGVQFLGNRLLRPATVNAAHEFKTDQRADKPLETNEQVKGQTGQVQFGLEELRKNHPVLDGSFNSIEQINGGAGTQSTDQQAVSQSQVYDQSALPKTSEEVYAKMERAYLADPKLFEGKLRKAMLKHVKKDPQGFLESMAQEADKTTTVLTRQHDRYKEAASGFGVLALLMGFNTMLGSIGGDLSGLYPQIFVISTVMLIGAAIVSVVSGRGAKAAADLAGKIRKVAAEL